MKATLTKTAECWLVILEWENGDRLDYRFPTKTAALYWARRAGVPL